MGHMFESVPAWVWLLAVSASAWIAVFVSAVLAHRRAERWRFAARVAAADARIWRSVAESTGAPVFSRKTVVAPQFHAPARR